MESPDSRLRWLLPSLGAAAGICCVLAISQSSRKKHLQSGTRAVSSNGLGKRPPALVIAGPSGVGKGTMIKELQKRFPSYFGFSVSHTTRAPRPGEVNHKDYHFTTQEDMQAAIDAGKFLEHANVHGKMYGTSFEAVDSVTNDGKICILDIDVQGVRKVQEAKLSPTPKFVFIMPPARPARTPMQVLESRLRGRGTETDEKIRIRLQNAKGEIEYAQANNGANFDKVIVNSDVSDAVSELSTAVLEWSQQPLSASQGFALVICGPSGVGKGTIIAELQKSFPNDFGFSVSHTTRAPRPGEVDGTHYHFTTDESFQKGINENLFLEHAGVHGKRYGTSRAAVESVIASGKICILDIDVQGVRKVKEAKLSPSPMFVFIMPPTKLGVQNVPDMVELERRLRGRGTEDDEKIKGRIKTAVGEIAYGLEKGGRHFDETIWHEYVETARSQLVASIHRWRNRLLPSGGYALVIAGPSGVGKGTMIKELMSRHPDDFRFSVSHTTRTARPGEVDGKDYHFTTRAEMQKDIDAGQFLEHADVHGNLYGTSRTAVDYVVSQGKICILDIDVQGVQNVKAANISPQPRYVFVMPPDQPAIPAMAVLEHRLRGRGTETDEKIQTRLETAQAEFAYAEEKGGKNFDAIIVNDNLEVAMEELIATIGI